MLRERIFFVEQLSSNILEQCVQLEKEKIKVIDDFFENELKDALDYVANDIDDNLEDSVDLKKRSEITKKKKLCESGHINDNVRSKVQSGAT